MRSQLHASADNESLQADVMRFMAIIAFCLIAILALVKDTPPPDIEPVVVVPEPTIAEPVPEPEPAAEPALAPRAPSNSARGTALAASNSGAGASVAASNSGVGAASAANGRFRELHSRLGRPRLKPLPQKKIVASTAPSSSAASNSDTGLSLRFASEGDFLRLISRGDVTVFAYRDDAIWALSRDYVFRGARAAKQVYELELNTIPQLVSEAFLRHHPSPDNFTWGVSLPRRIESQIQSYVQRVESGVLLIDRYGEVRHVGTS